MKYMGSKSRVAKHILPFIQDCINENKLEIYEENFCGGCNVLDKVECKTRIGKDKQTFLIELMQNLDKLHLLPEKVDRQHYNSVRNEYNNIVKNPNYKSNYENWYIGAIGFLASYNGRFFDGGFAQSGYEKTKNGERFRDYYSESKSNLLEQSKKLEDVQFWCLEYSDVSYEMYHSGMFLYSDPPYKNAKQYGISKNFDYEGFYSYCCDIASKTFHLISEQEMPSDFVCVWEKPVSRSIKATDKSVATEKLFTHKDGLYYKWFSNRLKN